MGDDVTVMTLPLLFDEFGEDCFLGLTSLVYFLLVLLFLLHFQPLFADLPLKPNTPRWIYGENIRAY